MTSNILELVSKGSFVSDNLETHPLEESEHISWVNQVISIEDAFNDLGQTYNPEEHKGSSSYEVLMMQDLSSDTRKMYVINMALKKEINKINDDYASVNYGGKPTVLNEIKCPTFEHQTHEIRKINDVKTWFENKPAYKATINGSGKLNIKKVNIIDEWWKSSDRKEYPKGIVMAPNQQTPGAYNTYQGLPIEPVEGDWSLFKKLILEALCDNDEVLYEWVLDWMASAIQHPETRYGVALVLKGGKGIGKGKFAEWFGKLFGKHYLHITQEKHLTGNFNAHQIQAILMFADELIWGGQKQQEGVLKALITEDSFMVERKGYDATRAKNYIRLLVASNNEWPVPASAGERRWCVCACSDKFKGDHSFFNSIDQQMQDSGLEAMMFELKFRKITTQQRQAPKTKALGEIAIKGFTHLEQWVHHLLEPSTPNLSFAPHNIWSVKWGADVTVDVLYESYKVYCTNNNLRDIGSKSSMSKAFKKLLYLPKAQRKRANGASRPSSYELPTLKLARKNFEKAVDVPLDWID